MFTNSEMSGNNLGGDQLADQLEAIHAQAQSSSGLILPQARILNRSPAISKFGAGNRIEAARLAREKGWL